MMEKRFSNVKLILEDNVGFPKEIISALGRQ
jgi:hypothetical protein